MTSTTDDRPTYGATFWIGLAIGWGVMGYAFLGIATNVWLEDRPMKVAVWVLAGLVAHDLLIAPMVTAVGLAMAWFLPRWLRGPVAGALALSGLVLLFSYPLLRAFGRRHVNPSILPQDYGRNVALLLAIIWSIALVVIAVRVIGRRSSTT
jgi:hypothetical protein